MSHAKVIPQIAINATLDPAIFAVLCAISANQCFSCIIELCAPSLLCRFTQKKQLKGHLHERSAVGTNASLQLHHEKGGYQGGVCGAGQAQ
jgi:hypothetical protein